MYDYLHLTQKGYDKAFEPVNELLLQLLSEIDSEHVRTEAEGASAEWNDILFKFLHDDDDDDAQLSLFLVARRRRRRRRRGRVAVCCCCWRRMLSGVSLCYDMTFVLIIFRFMYEQRQHQHHSFLEQ